MAGIRRREFRFRSEAQTLFRRQISEKTADAAAKFLYKPTKAASRTLANSMERWYYRRPLPKIKSSVEVPHYWAKYLHDGRGFVRPKRKKVLVWFRHPALRNDPRLTSGYPVKKKDIRRLTKDQFYTALHASKGKRKFLLKNGIIRVAKQSRRFFTNKRFFETPGFVPTADTIVKAAVKKYLRVHYLLEVRPVLKIRPF